VKRSFVAESLVGLDYFTVNGFAVFSVGFAAVIERFDMAHSAFVVSVA